MSRFEAAAYSIDGRTFEFSGPIMSGIRPGSYAAIKTPGGDEHLGQILELHPEPGATFAEPTVRGSGRLLSESADKPFTGGALAVADPALLRRRLPADKDKGAIRIGGLADVGGVAAVLRASGFGRHTFVCGQSGSGKTYSMGVVLERILHHTSLRVVILDPNSDYVNIGSLAAPAAPEGPIDTATWNRHQKIAAGLRVLGGETDELKLWLGNLTPRQQTTVLGLDPIADAEEVGVALQIADDLGTSRFSPADLARHAQTLDDPAAHRLALRITNLRLDRMDIWADEQHPAIIDRIGDDWRTAVFDLGSLASQRERSIITAAVVSAVWERRHERRPLLLVVDEAHNVCPQIPMDANQALATEHMIAIAGEGRKYGIFLLLATQRPTKIHENVLSQCDNLLLMRMNSAADIAHLSTAFSGVPAPLIERSATFRLGEGLAAGQIAPHPLLFKTGERITVEGGSDIPTDWTRPED
ncbi:MAG TPA: ATP-binding protein [Jiangellaceae bacterium]